MRLMRTIGLAAVVAGTALVGTNALAQTSVATETALQSGIARAPQQIGNYLDLAKLYYEQGRYEEAERILEQAATMVRRQRALSISRIQPAPVRRAVISGAEVAAIRVGGDVAEPKKIKDARPVYPAAAQAARIQGVVILELRIDTEGNVTEARVMRSIAALDAAAIDAVLQWRFTPTLLNGVPTPVIMTVTVNFTLS